MNSEVRTRRIASRFLIKKLFMEIKGTAFEIIAQVNNLKQVKENIFQDKKGNRYYLNKFGFTPVEIFNSASIRAELNSYIHNLKLELIKVKEQRDESDRLINLYKLDIKERINEGKEGLKHRCEQARIIAKRRELLYKKKMIVAITILNEIHYAIHDETYPSINWIMEKSDVGELMKQIKESHRSETHD